ncbi:MAG: hypothetical protein II369_00595 [Clostridia bacterium]|nr:hypothetical protein [Clostridia bacterium]
MGFGYLLIGYLITFVIHMTLQSLGLGGLALLVGYGTMLLGLVQLNRFQSAFAYAKWILPPLLVTALYDCCAFLSEQMLLELPFFNAEVASVMGWISFALVILFHFALLYAICVLAQEVALPVIRIKAMRNMVLVILYAVIYLLAELPLLGESVRSYLLYPIIFLQLAWILCNLLLFLNCAKDICPEGEEDPQPKRYRWNLLNRIGDAYESNRQRAVDRVTRETEERMARKRAEREKKKITHRKKKR